MRVSPSQHDLRMLSFLRYKRDEIQIEAWESQQKAKLEAEMRRIEVFLKFLFSVSFVSKTVLF